MTLSFIHRLSAPPLSGLLAAGLLAGCGQQTPDMVPPVTLPGKSITGHYQPDQTVTLPSGKLLALTDTTGSPIATMLGQTHPIVPIAQFLAGFDFTNWDGDPGALTSGIAAVVADASLFDPAMKDTYHTLFHCLKAAKIPLLVENLSKGPQNVSRLLGVTPMNGDAVLVTHDSFHSHTITHLGKRHVPDPNLAPIMPKAANGGAQAMAAQVEQMIGSAPHALTETSTVPYGTVEQYTLNNPSYTWDPGSFPSDNINDNTSPPTINVSYGFVQKLFPRFSGSKGVIPLRANLMAANT